MPSSRGRAGWLRPVEVPSGRHLDDDLLTIPKYPGKTNEQLTHVLLNLTLAATDLPPDGHRRCVLDPLAGRGTTLSWALTLGYDAVGVEVEQREVEAYAAFLTTWLRRKRVKHRIGTTTLRRSGQRLGEVLEASIGRDDPQTLVVHAADTLADRRAAAAPAGRRGGDRRALRRGPREPVGRTSAGRSGPQPRRAAGGGGARLGVGAAGRRRARHRVEHPRPVAGGPRRDLRGCRPGGVRRRPLAGLAHRVDAGIHRDLLVARKPRGTAPAG